MKYFLSNLDRLVANNVFPNRSRAVQQAVQEKIDRINKVRLSRECAKLYPQFEQTMAEEGLSAEIEEWPEY